ncbi:unnamed protein product, partial [Meganyctiphanes norvegica]
MRKAAKILNMAGRGKMEEQDSLFLSIRRNGETIVVPAETLVALFTLQYCRDPAVSVILVTDNNEQVPGPTNIFFPVDTNSFSFSVKLLNRTECPKMVQHCMLPALLSSSKLWCVAGLCSSLRSMLKKTVEINRNHQCKGLLGFKGGCLQACAEVSVWTKFCEIESIEMLKSCLVSLQSDEVEIPREMLRYENHMRRPPILHQALKKKQEHIRKTIKDEAKREELLKKKLSDLPELEHNYAEGVDMTLADIMLFASFHLIIAKLKTQITVEKYCPLVMKWYHFILEHENVSIATSILQDSCNEFHDEVKQDNENSEIIIPEVEQDSLYKSDPERYKPRWRAFTHQEDIDQVVQQITSAGIIPVYDEHPKGEGITLKWEAFPSAISPQEGKLPASRLQRKHEQLDNIVSAVMSIAKDGDSIVDFCAGGGHVGIVLAYCLPKCNIMLVENKGSSLLYAEERIKALGLTNIYFFECNLDYFHGRFDIGVSLHACGTATDLVLQKCIERNASFVSCPCCYGAVRPNHILEYPRSQKYHDIGITLSNYLTLGHAADQTHDEDNPKTEQGQHCMRLLDTDRLSYANSLGYKTQLIIMKPKTCSPKNHLLIGINHN